MLQMPEGYQIPDDPDAGRMDGSYLRTCLGMPTPLSGEPPPFQSAVKRAHFHMAHALRRLGALSHRGMDATQIATVIALASLSPEDEDTGPVRTFRDEIDDGMVSQGEKVVMRFRGIEQAGHFLRVEGDKIIVLHEGHERNCAPTSIRIRTDGEFPNVPDQIIRESCVT